MAPDRLPGESKITKLRCVLLAGFLFLPLFLVGQGRSSFEQGKLLFGGYATGVTIEHFSSHFGIGVSYEHFFSKRFSFGGIVSGGPDYGEVSPALLGSLGLAVLNGNSGNPILVLLTPLIIENPTFYFGRGPTHDFSLSLSLLRFRYMFQSDSYYDEQHWFSSGSVTLRMTAFSQGNWHWSFFAEATMLYITENPKGFQFGVALRHLSLKSSGILK